VSWAKLLLLVVMIIALPSFYSSIHQSYTRALFENVKTAIKMFSAILLWDLLCLNALIHAIIALLGGKYSHRKAFSF
jgi:hypothetical protein